MNRAESQKEITLKECDINGVLYILTKGNTETMEIAWNLIGGFIKDNLTTPKSNISSK